MNEYVIVALDTELVLVALQKHGTVNKAYTDGKRAVFLLNGNLDVEALQAEIRTYGILVMPALGTLD